MSGSVLQFMFMQVLNANNATTADSHEINTARLSPGKKTTSTTMEASTVWAEIENGSENVDIKHEPLEPYVEYPVSLFIFIHIFFHLIIKKNNV